MPAFSLRSRSADGPRTVVTTSSCSLLLIYQSRKDERLSWPTWLTYSGWFTHISGHPSAAGRSQDSKSSPVKDQRSNAAPRNKCFIKARSKKSTNDCILVSCHLTMGVRDMYLGLLSAVTVVYIQNHTTAVLVGRNSQIAVVCRDTCAITMV